MRLRLEHVHDMGTEGLRREYDERVRRIALPGRHEAAGGALNGDAGFEEVVVKVKNRYYDMRAVLASLQFNVVKHEPHAKDTSESKIYLSKLLPAELKRGHRSIRTVVYAE